MTYNKVMFSGRAGRTAGLVLASERVTGKTIAELSRLFPYTEANKMSALHVSPDFPTWEDAFNYQFEQ